MSKTRSRPGSTGSASSGFLQDVPGAFPEPSSPVASNSQSLSQAIHARRAEFTRPKNVKIKVGTWNTAGFKGTEKDVGGWFVDGKGVTEALTGLKVTSPSEPHSDEVPDSSALDDREGVESQESRYKRKSCTLPENDPGLVPGGDEVGLYVLGLQEVVDVNSATEALRPYTDPSVAQKWKAAIEEALPSGYQFVAEQQLIGLLILIYASKDVIPDIKSVSTTSVGTGLMGYMGNKGAVTARIVLGETTRLVFINCHLAAGTDKGAVERRNWDFGQIVSRTKFEPIQDSMGLSQNAGEMIGDEDFAFAIGDLNYRLEGIPGDDVRRLLMLHTRNQYDLSQSQKIDSELDKTRANIERRARSSTGSTTSSAPSVSLKGDNESQNGNDTADFTSIVEDQLDPSSDPASLQTTLASLLPHDELQQQQRARRAFHDGWKEGPITFLPTYKYDVGSVGIFDSSEKRRAPSWCDRILYRTRRDKMQYESTIAEEEESRKKDEEMKSKGMDEAGKDEEVLYDYDPDEDADEDESYNDYTDAPPGVVITREGFEDELHLEYYTAHQRVLSSDHKPLDAVFSLKYDAVVPELKAKVHQEVARELDKAENETRPSVTVVIDRHHSDPRETSDEVPEKFEGVSFGDVRYAQRRHRSLTIVNTGRVAATVHFVDRPVGPGQSPGIAPMWLHLRMDDHHLSRKSEASAGASIRHLEPGDTCNVELEFRVLDISLARALNEGIKQIEDILVLRVDGGRDHFIPVRGNWLESSLGHSINKLIRIPEGGIRKLQHQKPDGGRSRDSAVDEQQPVKWSAPRELFRLTEAIEDLTVRSIAEWEMMGHDDHDKPPWDRVAGWPFVEESWTPSDADKYNDNLAAVCDAVDIDAPFEKCFPPETTHLQRLESLAAFLLLFLRSLPDGVVTEEVWAQIDKGLLQNEKEYKHPSKEEQRTWIQEILSQSPAHSISFILLTSMLDRIINEVATAVKSSNDTKTASEASQGVRAMGLIRRKTVVKDPAAAHRQMNVRALASIFGEVAIRASSTPPKGKERTALEDRKTRTIELFLTREDA